MITSIGEILVDVFLSDKEETICPGGAPFNIACNLAYFSSPVSFYGAVGDDRFGTFLKAYAETKGLHQHIAVIPNKETTQATVTLHHGERSFHFVRKDETDVQLDNMILYSKEVLSSRIVHLGSLMLSSEKGRYYFQEACKVIHDRGFSMISFDVNYREDIFKDVENAKFIFKEAIKDVDIIKFSKDELVYLNGEENVLNTLKSLLNENQIAVVTLGNEGSLYYFKEKCIKVPSISVCAVDTTGAGDAFYSYFLYALDHGADLFNDEEMSEVLTKANIAGALSTEKIGAVDVVPSLKEIDDYYSRIK